MLLNLLKLSVFTDVRYQTAKQYFPLPQFSTMVIGVNGKFKELSQLTPIFIRTLFTRVTMFCGFQVEDIIETGYGEPSFGLTATGLCYLPGKVL